MDFQGFSTDSFEQFIRALALTIFGPGVTVFGNGPDGGREATFSGKVNYPYPPSTVWEGYGVVQAKFKEKFEGTQKDQAWAAGQLKDELEQWFVSNKRNPKPEYFVFCTNVELSSAANGGKAAVERVFTDYASKLKFKDFAIWDANQLKGYIDSNHEIRRRFKTFFTTGDLLEEFALAIAQKVPNADAILTAYLAKELFIDEDARLSQAGDRSEDRIKLASVFVDLPAAIEQSTEPPNEEEGKPAFASLHKLLRAAACRLDPLALHEYLESALSKSALEDRIFGRFLYLGGPGSGKSTLGQFLAQIHRAALLSRKPNHRLEYKTRCIIDEIKTRCREEKAEWPRTPRYPFRVELNAFAKALAAKGEDGVVSLSEYLRRNISRDVNLEHDVLRTWLGTFPWLLILDGLDEVPSSSNRREVVAAIQNFLNEARDVEADLMIVASSRPDGYAGEFDGDEVAQLHLLPLSKPRALACARRYVNAKAVGKEDYRTMEVMSILTTSVDNPLIARLMRSPLQVTFMVTVIAASGKPSESRWQLFNDYYRTIYERELHKAVRPYDKVLNERRSDIDALHHRVGFILQWRAEFSGGTQSDMSIVEFESLVCLCLAENGLSDAYIDEQKQVLLEAAKQRLVFLTSRTPGRLSFDVRSLQEYMAAACLTNADSSDVIHRLDAIAHSAYWRNTLLFAIGRFFVESQMRPHRDKIRVLCEDLNRRDTERAAVKLGSRVALEILDSGTIGNVPLITRSLSACALQLLANSFMAVEQIVWQLTRVYEASMEEEYRQALTLWLGQKDIEQASSAWMVALTLSHDGVGWATHLANSQWPESNADAMLILTMWLQSKPNFARRNHSTSAAEFNKLIQLIPISPATDYLRASLFIDYDSDSQLPPWFENLNQWLRREGEIDIKVQLGDAFSGLTVKFLPTPSSRQTEQFRCIEQMESIQELHQSWEKLLLTKEFYLDPNSSTLAAVLEKISESFVTEDWECWVDRLPWQICSCISASSSQEDLLNFASRVRAGELGDISDWKVAEERWRESGIRLDELCSSSFPLICSVQRIGSANRSQDVSCDFAYALLNEIRSTNRVSSKNHLAWIFAHYTTSNGILQDIDPNLLAKELLPARKQWWSRELIVRTDKLAEKEQAWLNFYDQLGRSSSLSCAVFYWKADELPVDWILSNFILNDSLVGLLRLGGYWCSAGSKASTNLQIPLQLSKPIEDDHRLGSILVRISQHNLSQDQLEQIADYLSADGKFSNAYVLTLLLEAISKHGSGIAECELLLRAIVQAIPPYQWNLQAKVGAVRNSMLQAKRSHLDRDDLVRLHLPLAEVTSQ